MLPSTFTVHRQLHGSDALVEAFKRYAPLGLSLRCVEEDGYYDSYIVAYDHTLKEYMYYCGDTIEPMSASWCWLGKDSEIFEVTQAPTIPLQRLH